MRFGVVRRPDRAGLDAQLASGAVLHVDLQREAGVREPAGVQRRRLEIRRRLLQQGLVVVGGPDDAVRADEAAVAALDAKVRIPFRDQFGDVALLIRRGAARVGAVHRQHADRQLVAAACHHHRGDGADELRRAGRHHRGQFPGGRHPAGHLDLVQRRHGVIDGGQVLLDHLGAAAAVGLGDRRLDLGDRLLPGQHARDREEAGLQHGVGPAGQASLASDVAGIDRVNLDPFGENLLLDRAGQRIPDLIRWQLAVEQQRRTGRRQAEHVDPVQQAEVVAADEAGLLHQVGRADRLRPEAQVQHGLRARLLRVVDEVALCVQVLLGAEDLDRVLVRADCAVRAETEEDRADGAGRLDVQRLVIRQAQAGHVVDDADREPAPRLVAGQLREHPGGHAGGELLRRQAVAAAGHQRQCRALSAGARLGQRGDYVQEEWLAIRTGLLGPVEHGDPSGARGQCIEQSLGRERPEQPDLQHADPLALAAQVGHGLADGLRRRAHHDDHPLSFRMTGVVHDVILAAGTGGEAVHRFLHRARHGGIERVHRLPGLEVDVRVLRGAPDERPLR